MKFCIIVYIHYGLRDQQGRAGLRSRAEYCPYSQYRYCALFRHRKRMYLRLKILPKCHLTTSCIWQEVPEKPDLFWAQHRANGAVQFLACKSRPASSEREQQTNTVPLPGSEGITFLIRTSSSCSAKGSIMIWFLPIHFPTKFSFSPQNESVSADALSSGRLARAHAVLMQGQGRTELLWSHPEHKDGHPPCTALQHFSEKGVPDSTQGATQIDGLRLKLWQTARKLVLRTFLGQQNDWEFQNYQKKEESVKTRKQFLFSTLLFHQDLIVSQGMQEWGKHL